MEVSLMTETALRNKRLSADDWTREALAQMAELGVAAVAVEPIARRLKVTKGSFYWHFPSRDALLPLWAASIGLNAAQTSLIFAASSAIDLMLFYIGGSMMDRCMFDYPLRNVFPTGLSPPPCRVRAQAWPCNGCASWAIPKRSMAAQWAPWHCRQDAASAVSDLLNTPTIKALA